MLPVARLFYCAEGSCRKLKRICPWCDRGDRYCSDGCSSPKRLETRQRSREKQRNERSDEDREKDRIRQRRHRAQVRARVDGSIAEGVTGHGSPAEATQGTTWGVPRDPVSEASSQGYEGTPPATGSDPR